MNVLLLMQSINQHYFDTIISALPEGSIATILTGSDIKVGVPHTLVKTVPHSPISLMSRLHCWFKYAKDVRKWYKSHKKDQIDLIYAVSNPPINSFIGVWLKKKFNARFVFMEWDIYPQIIEETLHSLLAQVVCKIWHRKNNCLFPQIDCVITIGECMRQSICAPIKKSFTVRIVPLYTDVEIMRPIMKFLNPFILDHGLQDKFIIVYSGKMGLGHNIPLILDAANILEKRQKNIVFLMIGDGPGFKLTKERIEKGSANIVLLPLQPTDVFRYSMAAGDIGIVSEEEQFARLFLPSKSIDMMACGLPIIGICTNDDDLHTLITQNNVGTCILSKNAEDLANAILGYYLDKNKCIAIGERAREVAVTWYSRVKVREVYKQLFADVMSEERRV